MNDVEKKFIKTILDSRADETCTRFRLKSNPISFDSERHIDIQDILFFVYEYEISLNFSNGYIRIDFARDEYDVAGNTFKDAVEMSKVLNLIETKILLANIKEENKD